MAAHLVGVRLLPSREDLKAADLLVPDGKGIAVHPWVAPKVLARWVPHLLPCLANNLPRAAVSSVRPVGLARPSGAHPKVPREQLVSRFLARKAAQQDVQPALVRR
jgi:hypothetical protein